MHTPLRRSLGNTKLKTRQDVRRFRKFLKRHYDLSSITLIDIEPDTMRTYLIHYLTSIRTRKGLKYDPETLRSYYLSIQRFLKDSNYPYCLRNSPQFAQCRDLIIQMRKEKNQSKTSAPTADAAKKRPTSKSSLPFTSSSSSSEHDFLHSSCHRILLPPPPAHHHHQERWVNRERERCLSSKYFDRCFSSSDLVPSLSLPGPPCRLTKDLLPSSSLPPRKRQQMKYFLESKSPVDFPLLWPQSVSPPVPSTSLSSDAYSLLVQFTELSSNQGRVSRWEQLLDQSSACGNIPRLMLTNLCEKWTGDIRLVHSNLRAELSSFLPHVLVLNILAANSTPASSREVQRC